jgi:hypothetical protein
MEFERKNISNEEWGFIDSCLWERETRGQTRSIVKFHGVQIPDTTITKQRRNYALSNSEGQWLCKIL